MEYQGYANAVSEYLRFCEQRRRENKSEVSFLKYMLGNY
jgi:hypothetical protein